MYEGAPDYPDKDIWWELCERYKVTIFYTRADRDPRVHEVGRRVPGASTTCQLAAAARHGRRADQPEGLALVLEGDRRRALPDRRHLVADRDRRDHDHDAAGRCRTPSRARRARRCRGSRRGVVDEEGNDAGTEQGFLTLRRPWPSMLRTLYKEDDRFVETYWSKFGKDTYFVGDAGAPRRGRLLLDHRARRRRGQRLRPPALDRRGRVGDRVAREGRRGGGDRPGRTRTPASRSPRS